MQAGAASRGIAYDAWRDQIDAATDVDQVVKLMRQYLASWKEAELHLLPLDLAAPALTGRDAIFARSVTASRAELGYSGEPVAHAALREMSRTFGAAAARLSFLEAYNAIAT
jgi:hypothetical protein